MLTANNLACRRGNDWLFSNFSFEVRQGQVIWLRGQNGRGKTSLLRLVVGLAEADSGTLTWTSATKTDEPPDHNHPVYIGHSNGLKDGLTALESLEFLARLHALPCDSEKLLHALRRLSIHDRSNRLVRTLSQGQRRRVALARLALETKPSLWVLDEPFDSLDVEGIGAVNIMILDHIDRGGCVFLTSHLPLTLNSQNIRSLEFPAAPA
jgi:heme exporter protein A